MNVVTVYVARPPDLEDLEAEERERQRQADYLTALARERCGVQFHLDYMRSMRSDARVPLVVDVVGEETPTYAERAAALEHQLNAIDIELRRVREG